MWIVTQVAAVSNAGVAMSPGTHPELGAMELMLPPGWDHGVPVSCCHLLQVPVRCSCPASILPGGQRCCVWAGEPHVLPHPRAKRAQCELFHQGLPKIWVGEGCNHCPSLWKAHSWDIYQNFALRAAEVFITFIRNICVMFWVPAGRNWVTCFELACNCTSCRLERG